MESMTLTNACDADWGMYCEHEKIMSDRRLMTIENILKEIERTR